MTLKKIEVVTLHDVKRLLDERLSEKKIPLSELTKFSGFNKDKLSSGFKELFGETITQYQIHKRMEKAAGLFVNTDKLVKEVAHEVGYHKIQKFIPEFKRFFHVTPTEYRKIHAKVYSLQIGDTQ